MIQTYNTYYTKIINKFIQSGKSIGNQLCIDNYSTIMQLDSSKLYKNSEINSFPDCSYLDLINEESIVMLKKSGLHNVENTFDNIDEGIKFKAIKGITLCKIF